MTEFIIGKGKENVDTITKVFNKNSGTIPGFIKKNKYSDKYIIYVGTRPVKVIDEEDFWKRASEEIDKLVEEKKEKLKNFGIYFEIKDIMISDDNQYKSTVYIVSNGKRYDLLSCILKKTKKGYALSIS